jgi:hypothetical protein
MVAQDRVALGLFTLRFVGYGDLLFFIFEVEPYAIETQRTLFYLLGDRSMYIKAGGLCFYFIETESTMLSRPGRKILLFY